MANSDNKVALQTTRVFSPYRKGEVFTLPKKEAKQVVENSDGGVVYYKGKKSDSKSGNKTETKQSQTQQDQGSTDEAKTDDKKSSK